jgi:hypothetical protein
VYKVFISILLIPLLLGCVSASKSTSTDISQNEKITALQNRVQELDTNKANKSYVDGSDFASELKSKIVTSNTDTYTRSQIDSAISKAVSDAINALKNDQSWVKQQTPTYTPAPYYPNTTLNGYVTSVSSPSLPQFTTDGSGNGSISYTVQVTNPTTTTQYVKPTINLSTTTYSAYINSIRVVMSCSGQCTLVGSAQRVSDSTYPSPNVLYDSSNTIYTISPPLTSTSNYFTIIPMALCNSMNGFQVNASQSITITIQITRINTSVPNSIWSLSTSI